MDSKADFVIRPTIEAIIAMMAKGIAVATTADIFRVQHGWFLSEIGSSVKDSANASYGRALSAHAKDLGIRKLARRQVKDDRGHVTTAHCWLLAA